MEPIAFRTWGSNPLAPSGLSMQRDWQNLAGLEQHMEYIQLKATNNKAEKMHYFVARI